ncbi:MAG: putative DNA binding domain-containing protein, partial [Bacteroidia bacterium]|nr:putative DNA binding domain-containing protein [Bacteroidia bacterium]
VDDDKRILGVDPEEEKFMLEKAAGFFCKPEIKLTINVIHHKKVNFLEVLVPEGKDKPYYAKDESGKWWVHIRVKDQSLLASKVVVDVLKRQHSDYNSAVPFTSKEKALLEYLSENDRITLKEYCKMLNISARRATRIMVNLVIIGAIRLHSTEKTDYYTLS